MSDIIDTYGLEILAKLEPHWHGDAKWAWPPRTNYYEHYALWASLVKPRRYLEIGVMYGWSTMAVLAGWRHIQEVVLIDSELYGIPILEAVERIKKFCTDTGIECPKISAFTLNSTLINELPVCGPYDLMHVDGEHGMDAVYHDLKICAPALAGGGTIIVDDLSLPGIKQGADRFKSESGFKGRVVQTHQVHYLMWRE